MSQQLSYPRPWSPIPGSESLRPLLYAEQKAGPAWSASQGHSQLLELSLNPEITQPPHFTYTL